MAREPVNWALFAARSARGLSQRQLAAALEQHAWKIGKPKFRCVARSVLRWEGGDGTYLETLYVLTDFFGCAPADIGFLPNAKPIPDQGSPTVGGVSVEPGEQTTSHRRVILSTAMGVSLPTLATLPTRVETRHVDQLTDAVGALRRQDQLTGGARVLPLARQVLDFGRALLGAGNYSDAVSRSVHCAVGELEILCGWLSFDAGKVDAARSLYHSALASAIVGGDSSISVHALANLGHLAQSTDRAREAVDYARAAQDAAGRWADPRLRSLLLAREATAWARLGDLAACQRLAAQARAAFDQVEPSGGAWFGFFNATELHGSQGADLGDVGRLAEAEPLLRRAVECADPERPRNALSYRLELLRLLVRRADWQAAAEEGEAVAEVAAGMRSGRITASLAGIRGELAPYRSNRRAVALDDHLGSVL